MTKFKLSLAVLFLCVITLTSCMLSDGIGLQSSAPQQEITYIDYAIGDSNLVVTIPSNWEVVGQDESYLRVSIGMAEIQLYYYDSSEFTEGITNLDYFEGFVAYMMQISENNKIQQEQSVSYNEDLTITSLIYSGTAYDEVIYNTMSLIEIENSDEIVISSFISDYAFSVAYKKRNEEVINSIKIKQT